MSSLSLLPYEHRVSEFSFQCMFISHGITRFGWQAWNFALPLFILDVFGTHVSGTQISTNGSEHLGSEHLSLLPPAVYGLALTVAKFTLGPIIGGVADKTSRLVTVKLGILAQVIGVTGSIILLFIQKGIIDSSGAGSVSFLLICVFGIIEALGTSIASQAVKKDWVPCLFTKDPIVGENYTLSSVNQRMSQIDLLAECCGPVFAGILLQFWFLGNAPLGYDFSKAGFIYVGLLNLVTFVPEYILLRMVYSWEKPLLYRNVEKNLNTGGNGGGASLVSSLKGGDSNGNDIIVEAEKPTLWNSWSIFLSQQNRLYLLTLSYALLWFNTLSPHGIVFTTFLASRGVSATMLSIFRGCGACAGGAGVIVFKWMREYFSKNLLRAQQQQGGKSGGISSLNASIMLGNFGFGNTESRRMENQALIKASDLFISLLFMGIAMAFVVFLYGSGELGKANMTTVLFLGSVVLSRFGLYGYDLGCLELQQIFVEEKVRLRIAAVETALCSCGTCFVYFLSICLDNPGDFLYQIVTSAVFCSSGVISFTIWKTAQN